MNITTNVTFKKILSLIVVITTLCSVLMFTSCETAEPLVIEDSENCIVIKTTENVFDGSKEMLLVDYMKDLKERRTRIFHKEWHGNVNQWNRKPCRLQQVLDAFHKRQR